jgi:hypothetical protein
LNGIESMENAEEQNSPAIGITRHAWQVRLERWRRVARYGKTRGQIEDAANRYARTLGDEVAIVSSRSPVLGNLVFSGGHVLGWGGLTLAALGLLTQNRPDLGQIVFGPFGIGILGLIASGPLVRLGRRLRRPSAAEVRAADRRRPVLLLASFRASDSEIVAGASDPASAVALEDTIGQLFLRYGPFKAIRYGADQAVRPGVFGEANWESVAAREMDQAVLLVAAPGAAGPVASEIDAIAKRRHAHKLLVLMPPLDGVWPWESGTIPIDAATAERRRSVVEEALGRRPRSTAAAAWDRTKRRLRSASETEEALRVQRWANLRAALTAIPGFAAMPEAPPPRVIAVHLVSGRDPVYITGPKVPAAADYARAVAYAIYGMKCHGKW